MEQFGLPVVGQGIDTDQLSASLLGDGLCVASVKLGLDEDNLDIMRLAKLAKRLYAGCRGLLAVALNGYLCEAVVAGQVAECRVVNHEGTRGLRLREERLQ